MENPIPINKEESTNSALHFFLYLLLYLALAFMSSGVGSILYQIINKNFPDITESNFTGFSNSAAKYGIASLFIAAPIFFFLSWLITKYLYQGKIEEDSRIRKWLSYIVLFIAAGTIIGDLIALIFNFLDGTIITRFVLKVLVILLIAGSIFGYYFWEMQKKGMKGKAYPKNRLVYWAAILVVAIVFLSAFFIIDSPAAAKNRRTDQNIINAMQSAASEINNYYYNNGKLPSSLSDMNNSYLDESFRNNKITYKKTGDQKFSLCAYFSNSLAEDMKFADYGFYNADWNYEKGDYCLEKKADAINPNTKGIEPKVPAAVETPARTVPVTPAK